MLAWVQKQPRFLFAWSWFQGHNAKQPVPPTPTMRVDFDPKGQGREARSSLSLPPPHSRLDRGNRSQVFCRGNAFLLQLLPIGLLEMASPVRCLSGLSCQARTARLPFSYPISHSLVLLWGGEGEGWGRLQVMGKRKRCAPCVLRPWLRFHGSCDCVQGQSVPALPCAKENRETCGNFIRWIRQLEEIPEASRRERGLRFSSRKTTEK